MILLGKEINLKKYKCQFFDEKIELIEDIYVNVQVQLKGCNAKCSFCELKESGNFDEDEFFRKISMISDEIFIRKINFSGGEPTLNFNRLERLVKKTRYLYPKSFIVINTNGYQYEKLFDDLYKYVDNIQLSRHHYIDNINNKIFGFESVSKEIIKEISDSFEDKRFLNLSCNLIKGYIDNKEEIINYLEDCSQIGISWVGFCDLIPLNNFCMNNKITFNSFNIFNNERFVLTKHQKNSDKCQCYNLVYIPKNLNDPISIYNKNILKTDTGHTLVFDGQNFNIGFTKNILI